jgi:hypothetical protein
MTTEKESHANAEELQHSLMADREVCHVRTQNIGIKKFKNSQTLFLWCNSLAHEEFFPTVP